MKSFVEQLTENYHEEERTSTLVPEFKDDDGEPQRVYAITPTLHHLSIVDKYAEKTKGGLPARLARLATIVLEDADGKKLIPFAEIKNLEKGVNSDLLARIFQELGISDDMEDEVPEVEKAKKPSPPVTLGG